MYRNHSLTLTLVTAIVLTLPRSAEAQDSSAAHEETAAPTEEAAATEQSEPAPDDASAGDDHLDQALAHLRAERQSQAERIAELERRLEALEAGGEVVAPGSIGARVEALEEQAAAEQQRDDELQQSIDDTASSILDQIAHSVQLTGYTALMLEMTERGSSFRGFRVNLLLNGQVSPWLRFYGELEFEDAAAVGHGADRGLIEAEQAYMELTLVPQALLVRFGIILVPFGWFNPMHQNWRYAFIERPLTNFVVFPSTYADVGVHVLGQVPLGDVVRLSYDAAVINGLTSDIQSVAGGNALRDAHPLFAADNNSDKSFVGRIGLHLGDFLVLGASGYYGNYDAEDPATRALAMVGADAQLELDFLVLRAEGIWANVDPRGPIDDDQDPTTPDVDVPYLSTLMGVVAEAEVRFWPDFLSETFLGQFDDPRLFAAARFDAVSQRFPSSAAEPAREEIYVSGSLGYRPVYRSSIHVSFTKGFGNLRLAESWRVVVGVALGF